jgi:uncharacterized membrane protein
MTIAPDVLVITLVMAVAAALCRVGGYMLMGLVPVTPRIEAGLNAIPIAVMIGIMVPPILRGGVPEIVGTAVIIAMVRIGANDLVAIVLGLAAVATFRQML